MAEEGRARLFVPGCAKERGGGALSPPCPGCRFARHKPARTAQNLLPRPEGPVPALAAPSLGSGDAAKGPNPL